MYVPHNAFFGSHTYKQIVLADYLLIFTMLLILFKYVAGSELDPPKVVHFLDESTQVQQHFLRVWTTWYFLKAKLRIVSNISSLLIKKRSVSYSS